MTRRFQFSLVRRVLLQVVPLAACMVLVYQAYIDGHHVIAVLLAIGFVVCCGTAIIWQFVKP